MIHDHPYPHTHAQGPHARKMANYRKRAASRNQRGRITRGRKEEKSGLKMIRGAAARPALPIQQGAFGGLDPMQQTPLVRQLHAMPLPPLRSGVQNSPTQDLMMPPDLERLFYTEESGNSRILTGGGVSSSLVTPFDVALTRANACYDLAEGNRQRRCRRFKDEWEGGWL